MDVKVIMLTGDNEITAKSVATELKIDGYQDAPALAQANIGIQVLILPCKAPKLHLLKAI